MSRLEKYPKYKDSGVEWLGKVPEHWKIKKLKFLGKMFAGLSDKKGDDFSKEFDENKKPFIPFTNVYRNLYIDKSEIQYVFIKQNEKQNQVIKNDILFLMSSETLDDIGITSLNKDSNGYYLNSFCKGFRLFNEQIIEPKYLNFLLHSTPYRDYFAIMGRGFI
jgi:type I restriction enzyme S subunit